ncbi:acetyl-CoA carboxylase biotin carboxylase subunit [Bacillus oleivorans]|uniref:biotin carboxylase n=1 Tax=Bacillus oleivorans TaxID=1448271 RepID=A0A285D0R1_9BACI|nr:biotin carboxylase N-terminal domain-containing protein [Bacillus oleivorans]SNX73401.1 acetyl-CoA carboxylase biotin carboxylase subunit [Bacillus oleivorans]
MKKILIANRGEIASRIIRTAHKLGMETVAVYSEADKDLPFVKQATYAYLIGEGPVQKSYLNQDAILEIAVKERVDGIHPGYGLLSENAGFCKAVQDCDITWIGPSPETISLMGEKIAARIVMTEAGVPVVPGNQTGMKDVEEALEFAKKIGFPIMLKASAGGGGVGLAVCRNEEELHKIFSSTKTRAKAYFQNEDVFIEKYIEKARHIEVQVVADSSGNTVHLYERDCSLQRRNQKVIEETPAQSLREETKEKLYQYAIQAAKFVNYVNAGTVEFIVDTDENIYFLEMNTRLQVEHPITEEMTGIDLVEWQIKIANGEEIPLKQNEINKHGHAIEFRIYAENPDTLLPSPGVISTLKWADYQSGRLDYGYKEGNQVTPFYDPLIAKYIAVGQTKKECIGQARTFFNETVIEGIKTNIPLLQRILDTEWFEKGNYTTQLLQELLLKNK